MRTPRVRGGGEWGAPLGAVMTRRRDRGRVGGPRGRGHVDMCAYGIHGHVYMWLLSQRRSEGLGGLESQPSSILGRSALPAPRGQNEPGVLAGDAAVLTRPLRLGSPAAVPEETADSGHRPGAAERGASRV
ncbi:unnamed protein product [Rangifer tarandus platyrhynchus]|uniref:Uncharacterized protein n=2 Tax=Rangifer tarandus platyrhynchus TaxID=3082113 RepID=A0ACB0FKW9_RANTA|nr:unnamed protein product [Rangifer tarandus platyrhynchus]CAI9712656.1 unnamed protein product [Rangifer tarandus platyrhynchus]